MSKTCKRMLDFSWVFSNTVSRFTINDMHPDSPPHVGTGRSHSPYPAHVITP